MQQSYPYTGRILCYNSVEKQGEIGFREEPGTRQHRNDRKGPETAAVLAGGASWQRKPGNRLKFHLVG